MKSVHHRSTLGFDTPGETEWIRCNWCGTSCGCSIDLSQGLPSPRSARQLRFASMSAGERRLTQPHKRTRSGDLVPVTWDLALREFTGRLKEIQWRHGQKSVVAVVPGQLPIEELALVRDLVCHGMGARWGGTFLGEGLSQTRLLFEEHQGNGTVLCQPDDFRNAGVILLVGTSSFDPQILRHGMIPDVIDLKTRSAGSEGALLKGIGRVLLEVHIGRDLLTFHGQPAEWGELAREFYDVDLQQISVQTGVHPDQISDLARRISCAHQTSIWWQLDATQGEGAPWTRDALNLIRVCRLWGQADSRANVALSPCGALGHLMMEELCHRFPLGKHIHQASHSIVTHWESIQEGIERGEIQGLWVIGTNSASAAGSVLPQSLLKRLEFLVVQGETLSSPFLQEADLYLPAAGWGEKPGTVVLPSGKVVTNSPKLPPPGMSQADFQIFRQVSDYWGCGVHYEHIETTDSVLQLLREASGRLGWPLELFPAQSLMRGLRLPVVQNHPAE